MITELKRVFVHIRWPLQSFTLLGFLFGMVVSRVQPSFDLLLGFTSWFLLCAGIVVLNSYYDKDTSPVAGLERPPKTNISMLFGAWIFKIIGFIIALYLDRIFLLSYISGVILSVLYSHKSFRLKSYGIIAVLFNFIIGATTFLVVTSFTTTNTTIIYLGSTASGIFLAAIYLMMQVHQENDDKMRDDVSIMVLFGKKVTLIIAMALMIIAMILSIITLFLAGLSWLYIPVSAIYFSTIIVLSYVWMRKNSDSISDFKIMNRLTLSLSYAANLILGLIYIFDILVR